MKVPVLNKKYMLAAIKSALQGSSNGEGGPFGACIVKEGKIIAVAHNTVLKDKNATHHAEIEAIRAASKILNNWNLKGCIIYSTTEPCPMCFAAIHWANIETIIYGTRIEDVKKLGFNELTISNKQMKLLGKSNVTIMPHFMRAECVILLNKYKTFLRSEIY